VVAESFCNFLKAVAKEYKDYLRTQGRACRFHRKTPDTFTVNISSCWAAGVTSLGLGQTLP
jgi:hypothetical protein